MQRILSSPSSSEPKLRRRRRWLVYLLRAVWFGVAVLIVETMLLAIQPAYTRWVTPCTEPVCDSDRLTPAGLDALAALGWTPHQYAIYNIAIAFLIAFFYISVAILIFRARPSEPIALFSSIGLMLFGVFFQDYIGAASSLSPVMDTAVNLLPFISLVWFFQLFYLFPDGRFIPRWTRWAALGWVLSPFVIVPFMLYDPEIWGRLIQFTVVIILLFTCILAPIYRYRHISNPIERQQTKWVIFGLLQLIALGVLFGDILPFFWPVFALNGTLLEIINTFIQAASMALMPITMAMALLRYRLWDVDRILNRTLVYIPLTSILTVIYSTSISFSQKLFSTMAGQSAPAVAIFTTIILTSTFTPVKNALQTLVDRSFKEPHDRLKSLKELEQRIFHLVDLLDQEAMAKRIGEQIMRDHQAQGVALYLRDRGQMQQVYLSPRWSVRDAAERLTLEWRGEVLGHLVLGAKPNKEPYTPEECAALQETTTHIVYGLQQLTHLTPPMS